MKQATILLMAIAFSLALAVEPSGGIDMAISASSPSSRRSRFLANTSKKCDNNPAVCYSSGSAGPSCCGGLCVNTDSDSSNCGKCGKLCKFTEACCGGKCVELAFDKNNCGGCFNKCKKTCIYGLCDYA